MDGGDVRFGGDAPNAGFTILVDSNESKNVARIEDLAISKNLILVVFNIRQI
jgi:hypothetical protein